MDWKTVKLGDYIDDIAAGPFGSNLKVECFVPEGFPIIDGANLRGFTVTDNVTKFVTEEKARSLHRAIASRGEVVVTISGNVGQIAYIPHNSKYKEYLVSQRQFRVRFKDTVDVPYLVYYFHSHEGQHQILSFANQTGVPALAQPLKNFRNIELPLPPLHEQKRIAAILSSLDEKIENNNRINANLEAQAQALYKSWFVDFEPWGGKMPDDWKEYSLPEIAEIFSGYSYKGAELQPSEDAMVTIKNFDRNGYFKLDGYKEIVPSAKCRNYQYLKLFDVVVAHTDITQNADIIGNPAIILSKGGYKNVIMSMDLCKVQPKHNAFSSAFIYCLLKDIRFKNHALGYVNGTTVLHLSKKALHDYTVYLPKDLALIQEISERLQSLFVLCAKNMDESQRLAQLRDTLLPKLMKGEIEL